MIMKTSPSSSLSHLLSHDTQDKTTLQELPADAALGIVSATRCCWNSCMVKSNYYFGVSFFNKTLSTGKETMTKSVAGWTRVK